MSFLKILFSKATEFIKKDKDLIWENYEEIKHGAGRDWHSCCRQIGRATGVIGKVLYNNIVLNGLYEYVRLSLVIFFSSI